jgi:hypothetical protein
VVDTSEWTAIQQVAARLMESYPGLPPERVTTVVHHHHARFAESRIRDFVPLFVERGSRRELSTLGG